jgi:TrkA domain protein
VVELTETLVPGVGVQVEFSAASGGLRVGVLSHRGGKTTLTVFAPDDTDTPQATVHLDQSETELLAGILSSESATRHRLQLMQTAAALPIRWVELEADWTFADATIADSELRRQTGASVVAVIRGEDTVTAPRPDFRFQPGDTAVLVGTEQDLDAAVVRLRDG